MVVNISTSTQSVQLQQPFAGVWLSPERRDQWSTSVNISIVIAQMLTKTWSDVVIVIVLLGSTQLIDVHCVRFLRMIMLARMKLNLNCMLHQIPRVREAKISGWWCWCWCLPEHAPSGPRGQGIQESSCCTEGMGEVLLGLGKPADNHHGSTKS